MLRCFCSALNNFRDKTLLESACSWRCLQNNGAGLVLEGSAGSEEHTAVWAPSQGMSSGPAWGSLSRGGKRESLTVRFHQSQICWDGWAALALRHLHKPAQPIHVSGSATCTPGCTAVCEHHAPPQSRSFKPLEKNKATVKAGHA